MKSPIEKLAAAKVREGRAIVALTNAATYYADVMSDASTAGIVDLERAKRDLLDAARTFTNTYHERSRCEKHVRDQKGA